MKDKSGGFPSTGTVHDLATSTVASAKLHTTEPADHHEATAELHLTGSEHKPIAITHPAPTIAAPTNLKHSPIAKVPTRTPPIAKVPTRPPPPTRTPPTTRDPVPTRPPPPTRTPPTTRDPGHPTHHPTPHPGPDPHPKPHPHRGPPGKPGKQGPPGAAGGGPNDVPIFYTGAGGGANADQSADQGAASPASSGSPFAIILILGAVGIGAYFYITHNKKGAATGDKKHGDKKDEKPAHKAEDHKDDKK